jgi:hypothetical protein
MSLKPGKQFAIDDNITLIKVVNFMLRAGA